MRLSKACTSYPWSAARSAIVRTAVPGTVAKSISVSGSPAYQAIRNASRSTSSSRAPSSASSGQLPIAQPLEHSKTKLSAVCPSL